MTESILTEKKEYIKVGNKEKILEFKNNSDSGYDEAEIILENNAEEDIIISKVYINNYSHFKCSPNIAILNKNSTQKLKVIVDDKNYKVSESDIFLIISHPIKEESIQKYNNKQLNDYFKSNNSFKEKGQKLYLIGYKKEEKLKGKKTERDELMNKIRELEKQVYDRKEADEDNNNNSYEINDKENNNNNSKTTKIEKKVDNRKNTMNYIYIGLLVLGGAFILYKLLKK
jgi:hypothetical protein